MKNFKVRSYAREESLLNSIVFFIIGIILFTNPDGVVRIISYIFGSILIIMGLIKIFAYRKFTKQGINLSGELASGILFIAIGIMAIIFFNFIETALRIIVGAYILYAGVTRLIAALTLKKEKVKIASTAIVTSSLMILFAILLVFIPGLPFSIIGLFIIGYAIMEMIGFIIYPGKRKAEKDTIEEAEILKEETTKEDTTKIKEKND